MRLQIRFLALLLAAFPAFLGAQSFQDNFSDGDFTNNPQWLGDVTKYTVSGANNELQLNDLGVTGSAALYVPASIQDSVGWEFLIRTALTTSGPSSSNRIRIYLQSDNADFTAATLNGYYLQIGETGSLDALEIFKVTNGSATSILRGTDGTVAGAIINSRVRIIRDNAGNWELFADHSGGTTFVSEGTATDNTHNSGSYFGVYTTYSSTQGDKFFYDDFLVSPLYVDVFPPDLLSATAISDTEVDLLFDEAVDPVTAAVALNYTINNGVNVTGAVVDGVNPALVHLTVSTLVNQTTYQVDVVDVEDLSGNAVIADNASFTYTFIAPAAFQDLIFNELMIDPTPVVNLPDAEYIELFNRSNNAIDLGGYKLTHRSASSGSQTICTIPAYILQPGEYVILHNDPDLLPAANDLQVPSFPALNNTSAYLVLRDTGAVLIDSILYVDTWYQDENKNDGGWSLELINPNILCKGELNWIASTSSDGGTPGALNAVFDNTLDTSALTVVLARQSTINQAVISFDDILDATAAVNTSNYNINGGLSVVFAQLLDERTVELTFNINMTANTTYTININNVGDCVGNIRPLQASFLYLETTEAIHYDLVINEIFSDANPVVGLPEKEFIEIYNRSNKNINLESYTFTDGTSNIAHFPFYIIRPQEYLIIYKAGGPNYSSFGNILEFVVFPDLDVSSDDLVLANRLGHVIDAVSYSSDWYGSTDKAEGGWTLERINSNHPCEGRENWTASIAQPPTYPTVGGTPGQQNSVAQTGADATAPSILRAFPFATAISNNGDSIRLFFSEAMGDSAAVHVSSYDLDNGLSVVSAYLEPPFYNTVVIVTDLALTPGTTYTLSMNSGMTDCVGNSIGVNNSAQFALPEPIAAGDFVINELLFNPVTGGSDYLELYNNSNKVLNVGALYISNTENALLDNANDVKTDYLIFPHQYIVLSKDPSNVEATYRTTDPLKTPDLEKILEFDLPSLDDDLGTLVVYTLNNQQAIFVDSFTYTEDWQSPLIDDLNGVALERIDFAVGTNDRNNWHSAAQAVKFGTPTYQNSSAMSNEITDDGVIQLPSTTFSPDGDGFEDFLLINYNIDANGFVGNISVYDAHGRFVRQLINNELLMQEGTIQWDGATDAGEKALVGPYIIFAEIFNPNGTSKRYKKTCVLAEKF